MSKTFSRAKVAEWILRARAKDAIVPCHWVVSYRGNVRIVCGNCQNRFTRPLVRNVDDPTFVCPNDSCRAKNFVPVRYEKK